MKSLNIFSGNRLGHRDVSLVTTRYVEPSGAPETPVLQEGTSRIGGVVELDGKGRCAGSDV
jgi:hypothetical protein